MAEPETPLRQAYVYAEKSALQSAGITRYLLQALETLPERKSALRSDIEQMIERTTQLTDIHMKLLNDILQLHEQYQAVPSPSRHVDPEVDNLLQTLTRIEARRHSERQAEKE